MSVDLSQFKRKGPCTHCPFTTKDTRIKFMNRERAAEIEEHAYRHGFPCHETAVLQENPITGEEEGYVFGPNSQHCMGYIIMRMKQDGDGAPWPGINNDEDVLQALSERRDWWNEPVFESDDAFLEANEGNDL